MAIVAEWLARNRRSRILPILDWMPNYNRSWLRGDLIAGLTMAAILIPESMAFSQLAGMPPQTAFYISPIGLVLYALFGTSRHLVIGTTATVSVMSAAIVGAYAPIGSAEFISLSGALAILAGLFSALLGILKLGRITQLLSPSVMTGFVSGLILVILVRQFPNILGIQIAATHFLPRLKEILLRLPEIHFPTLLIGILTLAVILFLDHFLKRLPAALLAMMCGIAASSLLGLEAEGVRVIGELPAGLILPQIPEVTWQQAAPLLVGAFSLALVIFADALGPAQRYARKHGYQVEPNQGLVALGMVNIGAGLFRGFPIGASIPRSIISEEAGANTQVSSLIAAAITVLAAFFLTPLFYELPVASLAIVIIAISARLIKRGEIKRLYNTHRLDFVMAVIAMLGVLLFDVLPGLLIAIQLSLLLLIYQASLPRLSVMGVLPNGEGFGDIIENPGSTEIPGLLIVRPNEIIFFANAEPLRERILLLATTVTPPPQAVIIDLELSERLDTPALDTLSELQKDLAQHHIEIMLSRVHQKARQALERSGLVERIGEEHIFRKTADAVRYFTRSGRATRNQGDD